MSGGEKSVFLCLLRFCRTSGWSAAGLYGGPLPNFDCQCRILSEHVLQNHCLEAAMPKQRAYITQGHKGCCSCCCAFKKVVKYGSAVGGIFALLPVTLSPSLSIPPSCKNGLCLQGPHHLPADIQDMIDEWPRALSRLCQLLIIYTSYLCQKKAVWLMKMKTRVLFMLPVAGGNPDGYLIRTGILVTLTSSGFSLSDSAVHHGQAPDVVLKVRSSKKLELEYTLAQFIS